MREMRDRAGPSIVAILLATAGVLALTGCVPRPAGPERPSSTATAVVGASASPSETPTEPTGPTPVPSFTRPTPLPAPTFLAYTVKPGDNLTSIAREFHTTPRSIAFWSRGEHPSLDPESATYQPDRLEVGWILLLIPDAVFDEDELMDATPSPTAAAASASASSPPEVPGPTPG